MKIFFDNKIFINQIHGGPSTYFINLIENLKNYNCDVKLSSLIHLNNYLDQNKKNISDTCFKFPFNKHLAKINFIKKAMHSFSYKSHIKKINEFNPDIIHTTYYDEYFLQKGKSEKVLTVYDLIVEKFPKLYDKDKNFLPKKKSLDFADKIICISKNTKKDLINFYNVNEKKIAVIYLGCPDKKKIIDINTKPFILFVGTRWKYKNFFNLIIAFSQNKKIYKDFNIVCFGGGEFTKNERNKISDLDINKDKVIQIEGNNNLLYSYYKKASIFVYPTFYEGFGLPILESFLYECPVACSRTSSLTEVAGNGALYFDPNNTENISSIMEEILYSSEKRHKLIIEGNYQLKKFSWSECAKKTLDFYKS